MRNISFALTTEQFLDGSKDVTRRLGWRFLKAGDRLMACEKCLGLGKGVKIKKLGVIEVVLMRQEPLCEIRKPDVIREGFPGMPVSEFIGMYCKHMKCNPETIVTCIEFKRIEATP